MIFNYTPRGVCSRNISLEITNGKISKVAFTGGCNGNLKGISALVQGMDAEEAVKRLRGIQCGVKNTSCPDQLANAIELALQKQMQ